MLLRYTAIPLSSSNGIETIAIETQFMPRSAPVDRVLIGLSAVMLMADLQN
jgi:hypothetical protein